MKEGKGRNSRGTEEKEGKGQALEYVGIARIGSWIDFPLVGRYGAKVGMSPCVYRVGLRDIYHDLRIISSLPKCAIYLGTLTILSYMNLNIITIS